MAFSEDIIWQVWGRAVVISVSDALVWRKDECGAWINRADYGNRDSQFGWEIGHIKSVSEGGTDDISNLRPLQWENNVRNHDGVECAVIASGTENVRRVSA